MKKNISSYFIFIFLLAFVLRIFWFSVVLLKNPSGFMLFDSWGYWRIAENMEKFGVFSQGAESNLFPDSLRTPVFPFFIFFLKKLWFGFYGTIIVQILISSATCALTGFISEKIFQSKKAGIIAGIFLAIDFPSIFFANTLMTETLFTFLLLMSLAFFISTFNFRAVPKISPSLRGTKQSCPLSERLLRLHTRALAQMPTGHLPLPRNDAYLKFLELLFKYNYFFSAIFLALAILCRPVAVFLPLIFAAMFFKGLKSSFLPDLKIGTAQSIKFLLLCYVAISPWLIRNYAAFSSPFLSTIGEVSLLNYSAAAVRAEKEKKSIFEIRNEYKEIALINYDWNKPSEIVRFSEFCREESFRIIKQNPMVFVKNYCISIFYFFSKPLRNYIDVQLGFTHKYNSATSFKTLGNTSIPAIVLVVFQLLLLLMSSVFLICFLVLKNPKFTIPVILIFATIFYFALFSAITEVDARMRVPIIPFLCIIASGGTLFFSTKNRKSETKTNL